MIAAQTDKVARLGPRIISYYDSTLAGRLSL